MEFGIAPSSEVSVGGASYMSEVTMEFGIAPSSEVSVGGASYMGKGDKGDKGDPGTNGTNGTNGFSPIVSVTEISGGHNVSIQDATHTATFNVIDGVNGLPDVTQADNNKIMRVIDGDWTLSAFYSVTSNPAGGNTLNI